MISRYVSEPNLLGDCFFVAIVNGGPVYDVPPLCQIFGAAVLVGEVVGMFPEVVAEDGDVADHAGVVLVRGGADGEVAFAGDGEPDPAATEALHSGFDELFFEFFDAAEVFDDGFGEFACGFAIAVGLRSHAFPEEAVVVVSAAVVSDGATDFFGEFI